MQEIPFDPANKDILDRVRNIPALEALPEDQVHMIMRSASIMRYDSGESVILEGEFDNIVFFLIFGALDITVRGTKVGELKKLGDVFGEMGIIDGSPRSATITASKESLVVAMDDSSLGDLNDSSKIFTQAVMYRAFAEVMANRLRDANRRIAHLEQKLEEG